ncbi:TPA: hypothetical protein SAN82_001690 [Pseudomonas putida]|nr:hypothetical protein [Pseudomonas putida]
METPDGLSASMVSMRKKIAASYAVFAGKPRSYNEMQPTVGARLAREGVSSDDASLAGH